MPNGWELIVLGIAQDGGLPHAGCNCSTCQEVQELVACVGLRHVQAGLSFLFDATPDLPAQLRMLTGGGPPDGIFLTHAHIGHYPGLIYFGQEAMSTCDLPVHATDQMISFLGQNQPWQTLIDAGHIDPRVIVPDQPVSLTEGLSVTALRVPHRDELSDTVGYRIDGPRASALFIPDIDAWDLWERDLGSLADEIDLLLLDGTFSSADEVPGRVVHHPLMPDTRQRLAGSSAKLWFLHVNHTNPALLERAPDLARQGMSFEL